MLPEPDRIAVQIRFNPDPGLRHVIESASRAQSCRCWNCGTCDIECPVNVTTGRLRPQKIVRLANLDFIEEFLDSPEIWYCLTCWRFLQICPNQVKPSDVIDYARQEALSRGIVNASSTLRLLVAFRLISACAMARGRAVPVLRPLLGRLRPDDRRPPDSSAPSDGRRLRCRCDPDRHLSNERSRSIDLFAFSGYGG